MTEPTRDELMRRIEQLERANRRWRRRCFVVAGMLAIGLVVLMAENHRKVMNAMQEAELARQQARQQPEAARQKVEPEGVGVERALQNTHEALKHFQERIKSQPKKADDIPLNLNDVLWPRHLLQQHREPPHDRISPLERP
jgi:hypothetical protein